MEYQPNIAPPPMKEQVKEQRQVTIVEAVKMALNKYADFKGRASRSEYWWWALANFAVCVVLGAVSEILSGIVSLAVLLPGICLACRRLHDIGKGAGWIFISLIPVVGSLILLWWAIQPSEGPNRFGPVPNLD